MPTYEKEHRCGNARDRHKNSQRRDYGPELTARPEEDKGCTGGDESRDTEHREEKKRVAECVHATCRLRIGAVCVRDADGDRYGRYEKSCDISDRNETEFVECLHGLWRGEVASRRVECFRITPPDSCERKVTFGEASVSDGSDGVNAEAHVSGPPMRRGRGLCRFESLPPPRLGLDLQQVVQREVRDNSAGSNSLN